MDNKLISKEDLFEQNTIGVKLINQNRSYKTAVADDILDKKITRTKYLKLCWSCGSAYESYKYNSYACGYICRQNIISRRKKGRNPLGNISELSKAKNVKEIKEKFEYR